MMSTLGREPQEGLNLHFRSLFVVPLAPSPVRRARHLVLPEKSSQPGKHMKGHACEVTSRSRKRLARWNELQYGTPKSGTTQGVKQACCLNHHRPCGDSRKVGLLERRTSRVHESSVKKVSTKKRKKASRLGTALDTRKLTPSSALPGLRCQAHHRDPCTSQHVDISHT